MYEMDKKNSCCNANHDHIEGILCDVKNCQYHDCETHCTAKQIIVGPSKAEKSGETAWTTFKPLCE